MIWEDEQEIINELLYWQKRALEAERELEQELDYEEFLLDQYMAMYNYAKELEETSLESNINKRFKEERRGMINVDGNR
jgi:hypothetical protein